MTAAATHLLGRAPFTLAGDDPMLPPLLAEFAPARAGDGTGAPVLEFRFGAPAPPLRAACAAGPVVAGEEAYAATHGGLAYHVAEEDGGRLAVHVRSAPLHWRKSMLPDFVLRAGEMGFLLPAEQRAKNLVYNVFDHLMQIRQLPLGQSWIHASSMAKDGRGLALLAWGGVGKTTAMLQLVTKHGWRYLSDDLGLIDADGRLHRTPKRLQVYAYNLAGQPELRRILFRGRSPWDRFAWAVRRLRKGPKQVRRRVSAERLFGADRVAAGAPLTDAIYLDRGDVADFAVEPLDAAELARRAAVTVLDELKPYPDLHRALASTPHAPVLPAPDDVRRHTEDVLRRAFARTAPRRVVVPRDAGPDALTAYLVSLLG